MSVKEAQTGSLVKKVLRRKLTEKTGKYCDINYRCNKIEISVQSCEEKISEEIQTEHQRQTPSMNAEADQLDQNQFVQKLSALKRIFSVDCFTCNSKSNHDEDEYRAVTIFNTHTRDSVDLKTQPAVDGISARELQQCITAEYKSCAGEGEAIKSKTFKLFNSLIIVPKLKSKAKSSHPENSLQLTTCWRPKKLYPFFKEGIGESKECIPVDMIVLANEHTDDCMSLSTCPENEVKCPDVLTVSVDVTDITSETSNEDSKALETSHSRDIMNVMAGPQGNGGEGVMGGDLQIILHSSEESCIAQNSVVNQDFGHCLANVHEQQSINTPKVISERTASEYPTVSNEIRLHAAFNSDSHSIHQKAVAENAIGPMGNTITPGTVTENVAIMKNVDINMSDDSCEHNAKQQCEKSCYKNCPETV
ncbi:uncharacterized protein LOC121881105 [Scomber scombrus]|uniref:Uncharacterized protein LOC121881105 n=1 Tax=Scomber scombrus TaxID=13677 RepID=A0AAV1Q093_SCOSC